MQHLYPNNPPRAPLIFFFPSLVGDRTSKWSIWTKNGGSPPFSVIFLVQKEKNKKVT